MAFGADLFVIADGAAPAAELNRDGIHNRFSYGVRTMLAADDGLFMGMANASNIATDPTDNHPEGGWELFHLSRAQCNAGSVPADMNGDGVVNLWDIPRLAECFTDAGRRGFGVLPYYPDACCSAGDLDQDGDIDAWDVTGFFGIWFGWWRF